MKTSSQTDNLKYYYPVNFVKNVETILSLQKKNTGNLKLKRELAEAIVEIDCFNSAKIERIIISIAEHERDTPDYYLILIAYYTTHLRQ